MSTSAITTSYIRKLQWESSSATSNISEIKTPPATKSIAVPQNQQQSMSPSLFGSLTNSPVPINHHISNNINISNISEEKVQSLPISKKAERSLSLLESLAASPDLQT